MNQSHTAITLPGSLAVGVLQYFAHPVTTVLDSAPSAVLEINSYIAYVYF